MTEIINLEKEKRREQPLRAILYGPAGSGKTTLMRDFPKPLLVYDFDGKYEPLIGTPGIFVKSYRASEKRDGAQVWLDFWSDWKKDKKDEQWTTIVLDSLTSLDVIMFDAMVVMAGLNPENRKGYEKYALQLYGDIKSHYSTLFNSMKSCDKNIIVLAHEAFNYTGEGKEQRLDSITPLVTGGTRGLLSALFKDTWYLELREVGKDLKRYLHTKKYRMRDATTTTLGNVEPIEDPTYQKILDQYIKERI